MPVPQPAPGHGPDESATRYADPCPWQLRQVGMGWLTDEADLLNRLADFGGDLTAHCTAWEDW